MAKTPFPVKPFHGVFAGRLVRTAVADVKGLHRKQEGKRCPVRAGHDVQRDARSEPGMTQDYFSGAVLLRKSSSIWTSSMREGASSMTSRPMLFFGKAM